MGKNLGGAIIDLLGSERVDLRAAAATVLVAVGKGEPAIVAALAQRLGDADDGVRQIALEGLTELGTSAAAEAVLRKEVAAGTVGARRAMAQLLLRRGTQPAVEAVIDQLPDGEFGEQALQLLRHEIDQSRDKLADVIEKLALARAASAAKELAAAWTKALRPPKVKKPAAKPKKGKAKAAAPSTNGSPPDPIDPVDPLRDPDVARGAAALGGLLRLIGYLARPSTQSLLLKFTAAGQPGPIRLAAIAALRRIVAQSEARGVDKVVEAMIELAAGDDAVVAQSAVDTLRGARIPESLAKPFAALAKSQHAFAQQLAMERLPAGGGSAALKALVDALGGDDPTARDAAARGLAKAPEAVLPLVRALLAATDEQIARRYAGAVRSHRGHVPQLAIEELTAALRASMERSAKGKNTADQLVLERILGELVADVAPAVHVELVFDRARRLRKAGKPVEAFGSLKPLLRTRADLDAAIDDEQRFLLALLALEAVGQGILHRADDPVFEHFARLAAKGFPVAVRLNREPELSDETIYALGFRLLESVEGKHEDLGAELLQGIIQERPRSKLAKAAKNKLKLTGHLDD